MSMKSVRYIYGALAVIVVLAMIATPVFSALTMRATEPPFEGSHDGTQTYDGGGSIGLQNTINYTQISDLPSSSIAYLGGYVYFASNGNLYKAVPPAGDSVTWTTQYQDLDISGSFNAS